MSSGRDKPRAVAARVMAPPPGLPRPAGEVTDQFRALGGRMGETR